MTSILFASDLDRTLIYSARAFWLETRDEDAPAIAVAEIYQGAPLSYLTRASETLLLGLRARATFVPVTTRTVAQYRRVRLPGGTPEWAVTTNGGVLLHHGEPDEAWSASVRRRTAERSAPLPEVLALLSAPALAAWILRTHDAEGLFLYAIVSRDDVVDAELTELTTACADRGWTVSLQGRKLYCVPRTIDKASAVDEVRRRVGASAVVAAGDSLLDRSMLEQATVALRPAHGELHDVAFEASNLTVTVSRGILAGEELLGLAAAAVERLG
ncbi:HAD family hydrolase [Frondihabitans cladoniiphilus]|uniref:Hydroxymethylpyrimidine pyrophosphatase-like HAD family hydrolase n=1 Tax=Frondihabitans cladoniiphilus TaxID=715785 RepID=A0ABP8W8U6_9MICO